ncbi:MAG: hypothetical protein RLY31_1345 [Bacteroidota bacterium]|jgi:endonuclease YncB( thermonuclease family)
MFVLVFGLVAQQVTYKVVGIQDGDSVTALDLARNKTCKIRLAHIDCPESGQAFGNRAKQFTSDACFGRSIRFLQTGKDRYGRLVGVITVDGRNLNMDLVENGLAWHYKQYSTDKSYAAAEQRARNSRRGLWKDPSPVPPWAYRRARKG